MGSTTPGSQPNVNDTARPESRTNVGAIAGGVIGGLAIVGIIVAIVIVLLCKRSRKQREYEEADTAEVAERAERYPTLTPYYHQHPSSDFIPVSESTRSDSATAGFAGLGAGDTGTISPSPDLHPKARREAISVSSRRHYPAPSESVAASSNVGSQTGSASSRDLLSPRQSISATDVVGLRAEVENLRRVMQDIRAERLESPPQYAE